MSVDEETGEIIDWSVGVSVIEYPDGVELMAVPRSGRGRSGTGGGEEIRLRARETRECGVAEADRRAELRNLGRAKRSREESVRRAKSRVRRIVRFFGLRLMVTLTFPGTGVHEYDEALRLVQHFIHDHGQLVHVGGHYVAVPELHPGGHGWHWHILVGRRLSKDELRLLREGWTAYLARKGTEPSGGARWVRVDLKDWGTAAAAAGYAAKYAGKTFEMGQLGRSRRRFLASRGADVEVQRTSAPSLEEVEIVAGSVPGGEVRRIAGADGRPPIVFAHWD